MEREKECEEEAASAAGGWLVQELVSRLPLRAADVELHARDLGEVVHDRRHVAVAVVPIRLDVDTTGQTETATGTPSSERRGRRRERARGEREEVGGRDQRARANTRSSQTTNESARGEGGRRRRRRRRRGRRRGKRRRRTPRHASCWCSCCRWCLLVGDSPRRVVLLLVLRDHLELLDLGLQRRHLLPCAHQLHLGVGETRRLVLLLVWAELLWLCG